MTRSALQIIAQTRLIEAEYLFDNSLFDGAYYIGGYAIEAALKARICNLLGCDYPPLPGSQIGKAYKMHNLVELFTLGGLESVINTAPNVKELKSNWSIIIKWNEQERYQPIGSKSAGSVRDFLDAIGDSSHGILTWIKTIW